MKTESKVQWWLPVFAVLSSACLLVGCATGYHSDGFGGGFTDLRLSTNIWQITCRGNAYASAQRIQDFTLLRAAELALDHNYNCFELLDAARFTERDTMQLTSPSATTTTKGNLDLRNTYDRNYSGSWNSTSTTTYSPGSSIPISRAHAGIVIRAYRADDPGQCTYDAAATAGQLRAKYGIK